MHGARNGTRMSKHEGKEEETLDARHRWMGVSSAETRSSVTRDDDQDVAPRSPIRSRDRCGSNDSSRSIKSRPLNVHHFCAFSRKSSIFWTVFFYAIHLIGVLAGSDKIGGIEVDIKVPEEAETGSSIELKCEWYLSGGAGLYSVKWYKDDHEFFRYVPDDNPTIQTFPQPGINIDKRRSSEKSISLKNLNVSSSGQYKCEVSTEAPSFDTIYRVTNLTVFVLPKKGPEITGLSSHYSIGENVTGNCTVWSSVPKATLHWTVNGKPVPDEKTIKYRENKTLYPTEPTNSLGLHITLGPSYFENVDRKTTVTIKCIARVSSNTLETEEIVSISYVNANKQRLNAENTNSEGHSIRSIHAHRFWLLSLVILYLTT